MYAVGGVDDDAEVLAVVEKYDIEAGVWSKVAPLQTARRLHGICAVNGCVYAVGGASAAMEALDSVGKYDLKAYRGRLSRRWAQRDLTSPCACGMAASTLSGERVKMMCR